MKCEPGAGTFFGGSCVGVTPDVWPWLKLERDPVSVGVFGGGVSLGGRIEGWSPMSSSCRQIIV